MALTGRSHVGCRMTRWDPPCPGLRGIIWQHLLPELRLFTQSSRISMDIIEQPAHVGRKTVHPLCGPFGMTNILLNGYNRSCDTLPLYRKHPNN